MAAAAAAEVQALLRFLTQDAKVPLAAALPKINQLRKENLNNAENISKATVANISHIFTDEKLVKQILNAAKRVSNTNKRAHPDLESPFSSAKRVKNSDGSNSRQEDVLQLPTTSKDAVELAQNTLQTNRAPLVLAFAVSLLKYTMPEQPTSSRLSLAQAVVSANSQSKANAIGISKGRTAEDDGWARGQPKVKLMGREIAVMRRAAPQIPTAEGDSQATVKEGENYQVVHDCFWGLDLEALKKSNGPLVVENHMSGDAGLPIHSPHAARNYLLKSFTVLKSSDGNVKGEDANSMPRSGFSTSKRKPSAVEATAMREEGTAMILKALDLLFESWASTLSKDELDRRAWSWYLHIRPDVAQGQAGWGQKGEVCLEEILMLRRDAQL